MNDKRRVAKALNIIGPEASRALVEEAVKSAMEVTEEAHPRLRPLSLLDPALSGAYYQPRHKDEKRAVGRLLAALQNVEGLLTHAPLEDMFSPEPDLEEWLGKLHKMKNAADYFSKREMGDRGPLQRQKRMAAQLAARLLSDHGLPLTVSRSSQFNKLAAVLFGDANANLYHQCRCVRLDRNRD